MCKALLISAVLSLLLIGAAAPSRQRQPAMTNRVAVSIKDKKFTPATVTIKKGQTVVWTNNDDLDHTVKADNGSFTSPTIKKGGAYEYTFTKAGKFAYGCRLHPREKGTVVVQ